MQKGYEEKKSIPWGEWGEKKKSQLYSSGTANTTFFNIRPIHTRLVQKEFISSETSIYVGSVKAQPTLVENTDYKRKTYFIQIFKNIPQNPKTQRSTQHNLLNSDQQPNKRWTQLSWPDKLCEGELNYFHWWLQFTWTFNGLCGSNKKTDPKRFILQILICFMLFGFLQKWERKKNHINKPV